MTATTSGGIAGKGTFARGVHPPEGKQFAEHQSIEVLPTPEQVLIPLQQHIGAPCTPVFEKPRQEVAWGDVLGEAGGFVSAPVHSPIAGQTAMLSVATLPNGRHVKAVPVKAGEEQPSDDQIRADVLGGDWPVTGLDTHAPEAIVSAVQSAGLVGMGGAAFPTHVKLTRNEAKPVDTLLLNGCECEPYLTADHRVMVEATSAVVCGALLAARAAGADNIIIAIESNKPDAVDALKQAADGTGITVAMVETKYPMGGERQTVLAVLGREVPTGGLPLDVGVVVMNVGTAAAVARAVLRGKPLTHRVVTVSGAGIRQPKNLLVPIGVSYGELIDACGGLTADAARVVAGGPMMGFTISQMNTPVTKGTSGLTVLTEADVRQAEETNCVRCGRCVDVCPLNLVPTKMALASRHKDWDLAKQYHLPACCECGCCAYICPARLPLVQLMRMGKAQMPR
jgi:electron transport complex protein RnfC